MRLPRLLALVLLPALLWGCSEDKSVPAAEIAGLKAQRATLATQLKELTDRRFELSHTVIPAKQAYDMAKRIAGGEEGATAVQEAKAKFEEASTTFDNAYKAENAVKAQLEDLDDQLRRLGVK